MTATARPLQRRFGRRFLSLLGISRNPLAVIGLIFLRLGRRSDFRVAGLLLSARRVDMAAISEVALDDEYGFVRRLPFPSSNSVILDLGANIGCFSAVVLSSCPSAEVHSVEPSPDTFELLSDNRARYPQLRWYTHQSAIAADSGIFSFRNEGPSTGRKLLPSAQGIAVGAEAFDSFVTRVAQNRTIFLCKMDIEGAEIPIFAGAMTTLAQIEHFIVEVHGSSAHAAMITGRLSGTFPHVEIVSGRRSSKPMIHAWRGAPAGLMNAGRTPLPS